MAEPQRDRDLVRLHWPRELRGAFDALFAIDDAMAEVVLGASQPALAAVKLAWWGESLMKLDDAPPPGEPRLQAASAELLPLGLTGHRLSTLEDGWLPLLEEVASPARSAKRGEIFFSLAAELLGAPDDQVRGMGEAWSGADLARRTGEAMWLGRPDSFPRAARRLRPLTMLTALAVRDQRVGWPPEHEAMPQRSWTILRHRLTGRI